MLKEYFPEILELRKNDFDKLNALEKEIDSIKKKKNKNKRKEMERRILNIREKLVSQVPTESFYHLVVYQKIDSDKLRAKWVNFIHKNGQNIVKNNLEKWELTNLFKSFFIHPYIEITCFPKYSVLICFSFILAKPYISRDDEQLYIIDNPIYKDKVFKIPMIAPSSWKGNLRSTLRTVLAVNDSDPRLVRLFGNEKGINEYERLRTGRLNFYPTFFNSIDLEVINPHDRKTRAGTQPIYIESVPIGAKGVFSLLYVPFDLVGNNEKLKTEIIDDLKLLDQGIREMMLTYGFSAKKSSGFGISKQIIDGIIRVRDIDLSEPRFRSFNELQEKVDEIIRLISKKGQKNDIKY